MKIVSEYGQEFKLVQYNPEKHRLVYHLCGGCYYMVQDTEKGGLYAVYLPNNTEYVPPIP